MNRNLKEESDEKNNRKLFDEMRRADDQTVRSFSAVLQRSSKSGNSVRIGRIVPIFVAMVILISGCVATVVYFRKPAPPAANNGENKHEQIVKSQPVLIEPERINPQPAPRRVAYRPRKKAPRRTDLLISQWRSPTEFLLRTPGNEILKTVPKLDDSRLKINSAMPNDLN